MTQPYDPNQPQSPWGGQPQAPVPSAPQAGHPQAGHPQAGQQQPPAGYAQQQYAGYAQQPGQPQQQGYAQQAWVPQGPVQAGFMARLFDMSVTKFVAPLHAKSAQIVVIIAASAVLFWNIMGAIQLLSQDYLPAQYVVQGIFQVLLAPVWALVVLTIGRLIIEAAVNSSAARTAAEAAGSSQDTDSTRLRP